MADVDWEVKVSAPVGDAKTADAVLEKMAIHLSRVDAWTQTLANHFAKMGEEGKKAGHETHSLFGEILSAEFAKEAIEGLVEKTRELGAEIIKSAAEEQRMMRVFANASGSAELGRMNEEWADLVSKLTEFNEAQTEGAFIDLKRVGTTDQLAKLSIKAAADVAAVSKNKDEAFAATIAAFQRIERTGHVDNRALAPLGLGVKDFAQLDSMRGKSTEQIKKILEEGKVDRDDLFRLIMAHTGEKSIGERAAGNADLLGTKLLKLQELPDKFFKKIADTKGIVSLSNAIQGILDKLDPDSPAGQRISNFLVGTFDKVAHAIESIDFGSKIELLTAAFEGLEDIAKPILKFIGHEIEGWAYLVAKLTGHAKEFEDNLGKKAAAERLADDTRRGQKQLASPEAAEDFADLDKAAASGALGERSKQLYEAGKKAGKSVVEGYTDGVSSGRDQVERTTSEVMGASVEAARRALKTHSPSEVFSDIGEMTPEGYARGVERRQARVDAAVTAMLAPPANAPARGGAAGITFSPVISIHVSGAGGEEAGRAAAAAFDQRVREVFMQWLQQMSQQQGIA